MREDRMKAEMNREWILAARVAFAGVVAMVGWIVLAGSIARAGTPLTISPASASVPPLGTQTFSAAGGTGVGYTWSVQSPSGGRISSTGFYTAGVTGNVIDQVQVTDSNLTVATAAITVGGSVAITPPGITLAPGDTQQFVGSGGSPPYTWAFLVTGSGLPALTNAGLYTAGLALGTDVVQMTDSLAASITATVNIVATVPLGTPCTTSSTCPTTSGGGSYCTDGVCCDSACAGQCQACNAANSRGTCATIAGPPVGTRPACPMSDPTNRCSSMVCDGQNPTACDVFVGATVTCGVAACVDLIGTPGAVCEGDGGCQPVTPTSCGRFACVSDSCAASCTNTSECSPGNYCDVTSGQCLTPPDAGPAGGRSAAASSSKASSGCDIRSRGRDAETPLSCAAVVGLLALRRRPVRRRVSPLYASRSAGA